MTVSDGRRHRSPRCLHHDFPERDYGDDRFHSKTPRQLFTQMLAEQKHYTRFPPSVKQHLIFSNPHLGKSTRETCGRAEITRDVGDKTHELRNLCGVERAEKVGCVFYFQEEGRDTPQSCARHHQVELLHSPQNTILENSWGILEQKNTKSINITYCIRRFFSSQKKSDGKIIKNFFYFHLLKIWPSSCTKFGPQLVDYGSVGSHSAPHLDGSFYLKLITNIFMHFHQS